MRRDRIQAKADLGAVSQLCGRPETCVRFLGAELCWAYQNRLLVVMRQGYGYARNGHPIKAAAYTLASLPPPTGNSSDSSPKPQ